MSSVTPAEHIAAAEGYLEMVEEIANGPHPPAAVLADAGLLHAHMAVAKLTLQATGPRGQLVELRDHPRHARGRR